MDLFEIEIPNTAFVHLDLPGKGLLYIKDEDGNEDLEKPIGIEVFGPASNEAVAYKRKSMKEAQGLIAKKGFKAFGKRSVEETEQKDIERLCAMTSNVVNLTYKKELITKDTIWKVYSDPKMGWVADQVRAKIGDWEDFLEE